MANSQGPYNFPVLQEEGVWCLVPIQDEWSMTVIYLQGLVLPKKQDKKKKKKENNKFQLHFQSANNSRVLKVFWFPNFWG